MEFLGIGPLELVFILIIALLLLGPRDMAKAARSIAQLLRRTILSPQARDIQNKVRKLPYDLMREAGLDQEDLNSLKSLPRDLSRDLNSVTNSPFKPINQNGPYPLNSQPIITPTDYPSEQPLEEETPILPTPEAPLTPENELSSTQDQVDENPSAPEPETPDNPEEHADG